MKECNKKPVRGIVGDCICPVCSEVFTREEGMTAYLPVGVDLLEQSLHWVCRSCGP